MSSGFPFSFYSPLLVLMILLAACSPAAPPPSHTTSPPGNGETTPGDTGATGLSSSHIQNGESYSDSTEDMLVSFLDAVNFRTVVNEQAETVKVMLRMRDIPDTASLGQVTNLVEYLWAVYVYLDPYTEGPAVQPTDYYFALNTMIDDLHTDRNHPTPGTPVSVPFHELLEVRCIYSESGSESTPQVDINPDLNTLTLTGHIPGITSNAEFSFSMEAVRTPENLPMVVREARAPANIAIELLIANAQRAILAAAYPEAEALIKSIKEAVSTGSFDDPLAKEYLEIVLAVREAGYEVLYLSLQNGHATVQATNNPPESTILELQKVDGVWQLQT